MPDIHLFNDAAPCEVWLDPDGAEGSGVCIGVGDTREEAVADAVAELERALVTLRKPAPHK